MEEKPGPITKAFAVVITLAGILGGVLYLVDIGLRGLVAWTVLCAVFAFGITLVLKLFRKRD
jgi:hypothetical protein